MLIHSAWSLKKRQQEIWLRLFIHDTPIHVHCTDAAVTVTVEHATECVSSGVRTL